MNLRMIAVEASPLAPTRDGVVFRWTAHHIREIFLALLPKGFSLDGSSKLQITCGPRGTEPLYQQLLGASNQFREDFDFESYFDAELREREETILNLLQTTMNDIAIRSGSEDEVINAVSQTAQAVRDQNYSLKVHAAKLSRVHRQSGVRIDIYRVLNGHVGEAWSCEASRKDTGPIYEEWMGKKPRYLDLTDFYKTSEWRDGVFTVRSRLGEPVYELDINQFSQET